MTCCFIVLHVFWGSIVSAKLKQFTNSAVTTQVNIYALLLDLQCETTHFICWDAVQTQFVAIYVETQLQTCKYLCWNRFANICPVFHRIIILSSFFKSKYLMVLYIWLCIALHLLWGILHASFMQLFVFVHVAFVLCASDWTDITPTLVDTFGLELVLAILYPSGNIIILSLHLFLSFRRNQVSSKHSFKRVCSDSYQTTWHICPWCENIVSTPFLLSYEDTVWTQLFVIQLETQLEHICPVSF